jgi:hypothetical protein
MKKRLLFISVFTLAMAAAFSQNASFSVITDKQKILIGEPFNLTLQATFPKRGGIKWITVDTIPHFEILATSKIDSQVTGSSLQVKQMFTLTSWDSGLWLLPRFTLPNINAKKEKPVAIDVVFASFNRAQDYHDIKDIIEVEKPEKITWYWYLIGAALLLLLFLLMFPRRKKGKEAAPAPAVDAYKEALARLDNLKEHPDVKIFYTDLIHIFRDYVHRRKGLHSFQKTTDDLSMQLKSLNLPLEQYHSLVQTLQLSDMVKFARFTPASTENEASLATIKKSIILIENTK